MTGYMVANRGLKTVLKSDLASLYIDTVGLALSWPLSIKLLVNPRVYVRPCIE